MASAAVARGIGDSHPVERAGVVGGKFQALAAHEQFRVLEPLGHPPRSLGQFVAKALAVRGRFDHPHQGFAGTEPQRHFDHVVGNDARLVQFHGGRQRRAHRDRVHAQIVAHPVGLDHRVQVADPAVGADGPGRFVLGPFPGHLPVARVHIDQELVGVLAQSRHAPAGDGTREAGFVGHQPRVGDGIAVQVLVFVELALLEIAGRQAPHRLRHIDRRGGSELCERFPHGVVFHLGPHRPQGRHERFGVGDFDAARPAHRDGLQVLGPHHGTDAAAARRAVLFVHDASEPHELLAGRSDRSDAQAGNSRFFAKSVLGLPHALSPVPRRIAQFDLVVVDVQVAGMRRFAFQDQHVVAGELQLGPPMAAGVRGGDRVRQRPFGHHHVPGAARHRRAGQRPGGEDQLVRRRQRIDRRVHLGVQIAVCQTASADVVPQPVGRDRFDGRAA